MNALTTFKSSCNICSPIHKLKFVTKTMWHIQKNIAFFLVIYALLHALLFLNFCFKLNNVILSFRGRKFLAGFAESQS